MKELEAWLLHVLKNDLKSFLIKVFHQLNPETVFLDNWHLDLFCEYLNSVKNGEIKRLIINVPPRSLKSICVNVSWTAWMLGNQPSRKIISTSYSNAISSKHGMDFQNIISSNWYKRLFPELKLISNTKSKITTTNQGFRMSSSIGGTLTGEGADFLIVDDPLTPMQALSAKFRQRAIDWFKHSFMSRLNDKKKGAIVVIMQRLHQGDLSGFLLKEGGWNHLCIPAIAHKKIKIKFGNIEVTRKKDDLLHSGREGKKEIERAKKELGSYAFAAQYQQSPQNVESGIIKPQWLVRYEDKPKLKEIYQSWDCAIKASEKSDYTVCATFGVSDDKIYLLDILRKKLEYSKLKPLIQEMASKYNATKILVEDKASGQQLLQELKSELPVVKYLPKWDKQTRLILASHKIESGLFLIPNKAKWLKDFEDEILNFPYAKNDDQVDSITQFLLWYKEGKRYECGIYRI